MAELIDAIATTFGYQGARVQPPPVNLEAYDSYLKGVTTISGSAARAWASPSKEFEKALNLDATYAAAWAGLAFCAAYLYIYVDRSETHRTQAETASQRALALDPQLAEAHVARGVALSASGKHGEAEEAFETALRLDANLYEAYYFYARHCFAVGRPEEAIQYFEWAAACVPRLSGGATGGPGLRQPRHLG
ncbi:MAG: tetratricopeptide repeat protein [Holophaga sp.]|nr:tetratricopeptide repeat protein [Holophaga sp.]